MTERASPSPESRHAAISCLFGRAMLSLRLLFSVSILALSVTFGDSSPKGRALGKEGRLCGMQKPLPLGEVASRSDDGEGKPVSREPPHSDKQVLWQSDAIAAPALLRQHPCPLRRSAPALPKGEPWAKRAGFAGCKSLSLWERWHRASDDGEGKPVSREPPHSDKQVLWQSDAIAAPALLRQHPCPLRRSAPALPKGEPKGILPDGFSPFTQETGRFAQVLLIFLRRCGTFRVIRHPLFFTVQRRFLYVILS